MREQNDTVALVTGASRGIGARVAHLLAERGVDVVVNYRSKGPRAEEVAAAITALGRRPLLVQADLTEEQDVHAMAQAVADTFGRLDLLVLNASGGMEKDRPATYAMALNRDAQVQTVDALIPLMPRGGRIVFVTSHWAHFYGQQPVVAGYEAVAASKRAGEDALRERIPALAAQGISLIVVSGDVIEGTITPRLLERAQPGLLHARRDQVGALPSIDEFAQAIVDAAVDQTLRSGEIMFVGSVDEPVVNKRTNEQTNKRA
jgi:NAD(P)-dependent dehydrogenase (short-subunit alcohol dehydrogenase family)